MSTVALTVVMVMAGALPRDENVPGRPVVLRGHRDSVTALIFRADGKQLLTASRDQSLRVWSLSTGQETASVAGGRAQINSIALSPNGKMVAAGSTGVEVRLIDIETGSIVRSIVHPDTVSEVAFSADGSRVAVAGVLGNAAMYSVSDGKLVTELKGRSVRYSPDGKRLALAQRSNGLEIVDASTGRLLKSIKTETPITSVLWTPDGKTLLAWNGAGRDVLLLDANKGSVTETLKAPALPVDQSDRPKMPPIIGSVTLSPDGSTVVVATLDMAARVWSLSSKSIVKTFPLERGAFTAISPDSKILAVGDGPTVKLWPLVGDALP